MSETICAGCGEPECECLCRDPDGLFLPLPEPAQRLECLPEGEIGRLRGRVAALEDLLQRCAAQLAVLDKWDPGREVFGNATLRLAEEACRALEPGENP